MNQKTTQVAVADDHPLLRSALIVALQSLPDVAIAGEVGTMEELEQLFRHQRPDVLVLDLFLHKQCVLDSLRVYLSNHPEVRVLVLSAHEPERCARFSRQVGARGFISKEITPEEFKKAFQQVAEGGEVWPPETTNEGTATEEYPMNRAGRMSALTLREMEIFRLIGKWENTEEIADKLGISSNTVDVHRIHIKKKLGFASASHLLHFAVEWVELERG